MPGTQPPPPPDRTTYTVAYTVAGEPGVRWAEVTVVPGYSQESDIPHILAARLPGRPADGRPAAADGQRDEQPAAGGKPDGRPAADGRIVLLEVRPM
ncbi:hypothetical protein OG535_07215 [Kitasatospora sp. NBC_00085]|uniref:hypothetical protein n=1 Tax=unclassified Kitasatospora TaxID=2633591 RepID=UPI003252821A